MADYLDAASGILAAAQRRVEVSAQNVSNAMTPGYRRRVSFEQLIAPPDGSVTAPPSVTTQTDFTPAKNAQTGNPYDLAIAGDGLFVVRDGDRVFYTRNGQFHRDGEGRVITQKGAALQVQGGGDLVLKGDRFEVLPDGAVTQSGEAIGKLDIVAFNNPGQAEPVDGGLFTTLFTNVAPLATARLQQGALEAANVVMGDEMIDIMASLRSAQAGQKLLNVYDDLMGRAVTAFGGN